MSAFQHNNKNKEVIVSDGVNIYTQQFAGEKGRYFVGTSRDLKNDTWVRGVSTPSRKISFRNLATGEVFTNSFIGEISIGRGEGSSVGARFCVPGDSGISRKHCRIYEVNGNLCIEDTGSKQHTYVNDKRLNQPTYLKNGDILKLGNTYLQVSFGKG